MNILKKEEHRIRSVYAERQKGRKDSLYAWYLPDVLYNQYIVKKTMAMVLFNNGLKALGKLEILDIGCGTGGWLRTLLDWGAVPGRLHGIDLLADRIAVAKKLSPHIDFQVATAWPIPFDRCSMDLITANTVFSSIIDPDARVALAEEMARVLRHDGHIMIYEFRVSHPRNPDTVGIRKNEIQRLFPEFSLKTKSLTLAPPLARKVVPLSPFAAHFLEIFFPFLRTHALYFLTPKQGVS